jgi:hypothetical protein
MENAKWGGGTRLGVPFLFWRKKEEKISHREHRGATEYTEESVEDKREGRKDCGVRS